MMAALGNAADRPRGPGLAVTSEQRVSRIGPHRPSGDVELW